MNFDLIWLVLLAIVLALEAYAHFFLRNLTGHTISNRVKFFEKLTGLPGHIAVGVFMLLLTLHLEGVLW